MLKSLRIPDIKALPWGLTLTLHKRQLAKQISGQVRIKEKRKNETKQYLTFVCLHFTKTFYKYVKITYSYQLFNNYELLLHALYHL